MNGLRWNDCFPWIEARRSRHSESVSREDWSTPVGRNSLWVPSEFKRRIDLVVQSAIEERSTWSLAHIFPTVSPDLDFEILLLSVRTRNCLSASQLGHFSDLQEWTVEQLFGIKNMGARSVSELVQKLAINATESSPLGMDPRDSGSDGFALGSAARHRLQGLPGNEIELDWNSVAKNLRVLAEWQLAREEVFTPLLDPQSTSGDVPSAVKNAVRWFQELAVPQEALGQALEVPELLEARLGELSDREIDIVARRLLTDTPETLDSIGSSMGVSRERIRQIESKALAKASAWLIEDTPLGLRAAAARYLISPLCTLSSLLGLMPSLVRPVPAVDLPAWFVLDKFDDGFEADGAWVAKPSIDEVANETLTRFQETSNAHGAAEIEGLANTFADWTSISRDQLVDWFETLGYRSFKDHLISPSVRGLPDMAAVYLSIVGASISTEDLYEAVGEDRSMNSLKNALASDSRFVRADKDDWALAEWGTRAYSNIREMIGEVVAELGSVSLDALIAELTSNFTISPRSIAVYANAWPFQTLRGIVKMAENPRRTSKSMSESRNVYRNNDSLQLRITVNGEHLRGSGFSVPPSLALAIGLEPGQKVFLSSGHQTTTFSWPGAQPSLGSIRGPLFDMDSGAGDQVMIDLDEKSIKFRKIEPRGTRCASEQVIEILGFKAGGLESSMIADALGLASNTPWPSIIHTLRSRGEHDLVELLIEDLGADPVFSPDLAPSKPGGITIVAIEDRL